MRLLRSYPTFTGVCKRCSRPLRLDKERVSTIAKGGYSTNHYCVGCALLVGILSEIPA